LRGVTRHRKHGPERKNTTHARRLEVLAKRRCDIGRDGAGRDGLTAEIPGTNVTVVEPRFVPGLPDEAAAFREAVRGPIGAPPLRDVVKAGDRVDVIYPLGNSFSLPVAPEILLVGGGCGVAPLLYLAQFLKQNRFHPVILTGWRNKADIFEQEEYRKFGEVLVTTEDGSEGEKGLVTDHSLFQKESLPYKKIYCCGPDPMMKAVAKIASLPGIDCEVSLENTMACGFGVCLCCITSTTRGNERVCVEGPVFNTKVLTWENLHNFDCAVGGKGKVDKLDCGM